MVSENLGNYPDRAAAIRAIAPMIGCSGESLRRWVVQTETDSGAHEGVTSEERARIKELEREVREMRQANEILKKGEPMSRQRSERHWRTPISPRRSSFARGSPH